MTLLAHHYSTHDFHELSDIATAGFAAVLRVSRGRPSHVENRFPPAWRELYEQRSYFLRDPIIGWALSHDGAMVWDEFAGSDPAGVIEQARQHGLVHGVTVSTGCREVRSFCAIARHDRPLTEEETGRVEKVLERLHRGAQAVSGLTPAQREALQLMAAGERHQRAAAIIGISESALKARLKSARFSLGARTTAEAVHLAQARGEI